MTVSPARSVAEELSSMVDGSGRAAVDYRGQESAKSGEVSAYSQQIAAWWADHQVRDEQRRQRHAAEVADLRQQLADLRAQQQSDLAQVGEWDATRGQLISSAMRRAVVPFAVAFVVAAYLGWRIAS